MLVYMITGGEIHDIGGLSRYVRELASYTAKAGFYVKVTLRMGRIIPLNEGKNDADALNSGKRLGVYKFSPTYYMLNHLPNPLTVIFGTLMLMRDIKSECKHRKIMHVHDITSSILIAIIINKVLKIPFLVHIHGFPIKEQKIKLSKANSPVNNFVWFLTKIWHIIAIKLMKHDARVILVNNSEIRSFYESSGIPSWKLETVPSAIDLNKFERSLLSTEESRKFLGFSNLRNATIIGYIGGLRPEKNVETLIKAFASFLKCYPNADVRLVIIGEGFSRQNLEEAVKELNIGNYVFFLGFMPSAYKFLNAIDIFVLPSFSEGSPFSLIEAMAAGKAIIASNIPAIREIVDDEKEALLFDPYNPRQLKDLILTLYNNPELRKKLGANARRKAEQYDVNVVYRQIVKLYQELIHCRAKEKCDTVPGIIKDSETISLKSNAPKTHSQRNN